MKQVFNPYLPGHEYIPDGEPYVFNDRLYIFGSHDGFGKPKPCWNDYVSWSAPTDDLSDWRFEGVIWKKEQDPLNQEGKYPLFAPDVEKGKDGRYYLFYAPEGTHAIGVAVCDEPAGKYEFLGHVCHADGVPVGQKKGDPRPFDPAAFVDEDGKCYVYFGFAPLREKTEDDPEPGPFVAEVSDDFCTVIGGPYKVELQNVPDEVTAREHSPQGAHLGHDFFEASSMRKMGDRYLFVYSSKNSHELCYAAGKSPVGPFEYGGVLHSNGDVGFDGRAEDERVNYTGNNHGSLVRVGNKWYIFGHRPTHYSMIARQGIAEEVTVDENGFITQAEMTSCGLNGDPLSGKGTYPAYIACGLRSAKGAVHVTLEDHADMARLAKTHPAIGQDGEDREEGPEPFIMNLRQGDTAVFKYFDFDGTAAISVQTRGDAGTLVVRQSEDGAVCARIPFAASKEWTQSEAVPFEGENGVHALYFTYEGPGVSDWNGFTLS